MQAQIRWGGRSVAIEHEWVGAPQGPLDGAHGAESFLVAMAVQQGRGCYRLQFQVEVSGVRFARPEFLEQESVLCEGLGSWQQHTELVAQRQQTRGL